ATNHVYYARTSFTAPADLFRLSWTAVGSPVPEAISNLNPNFPAAKLDQGTKFYFPSRDGSQVQGWLFKPPNFDSQKRYPLVVLIHGGPQGAWNSGWSYRWNPQLWA